MVTSPLSLLSEKWFGFPTRQEHKIVNVLPAGTRLLENNPQRVGYLIQNLTAQELFVGWDTIEATGTMLIVGLRGGQLTLVVQEDGEMVGYELFGRVTINSADVLVVEVMGI
jgi:hypothetical protein